MIWRPDRRPPDHFTTAALNLLCLTLRRYKVSLHKLQRPLVLSSNEAHSTCTIPTVNEGRTAPFPSLSLAFLAYAPCFPVLSISSALSLTPSCSMNVVEACI